MKTATITKDVTITRNLRGWLARATSADIEAGRNWERNKIDAFTLLQNKSEEV